MMWETLGTVRDLGRLQDIASVLIRWGFGDVVKRMGMAGVLEKAGRLLHWQAVEEGRLRMDVPTRLRCTLQDLGPTFVKLGQVLATRVDLLPPAWIDELGKLPGGGVHRLNIFIGHPLALVPVQLGVRAVVTAV